VIIGVPKEICAGETRTALTPVNVAALVKQGVQVIIEPDAGLAAGYRDADYEEAGARLLERAALFAESHIILQVQTPGSNRDNGQEDLTRLREGQYLVGMMDPLANPAFAKTLADKGVTGIALELIPRITRAQAMDVLSSMAMLAGYKAVLVAACAANRQFPMSMTAAGTLSAARVFVMGAGVAGLQACATAKRLGAVVEAYDVRPAAREQILSVGATPVELALETDSAEGSGGYAKAQGEEFLKRQRELMTEMIAPMDVVITTAAVPGAKSPILVTGSMVQAMKPGSVIVDLAAERGGNCELTKMGKTVIEHGVTIIGPVNIPASIPFHASQMYGKNMENLLSLLLDDAGNLQIDFDDEIVQQTVIAHNGDIPQARLRELLDLPPLPQPEPADSSTTTS